MANATAQVRYSTREWGDTKMKMKLQGGVSATYYTGAMIGQKADSYLAKLDDTAAMNFVGLIQDSVNNTGDTTDSDGWASLNVEKPWLFSMNIASAAAGDEGKSVYALYDNQVQYSAGSYCNFVGKVVQVVSSTQVLIAPPWSPLFVLSGWAGTKSAAAAAGTTLTKFDVNKIILCPLTSDETITLPAVALCSPGDKILFINKSSNGSKPTLDGNAAETINGAATLAMGTNEYDTVLLVTDGSEWYATGQAETLGATTFTGTVTLSDVNVALGTTTGTKLGTSASQKLGLWNATPIVQPSGASQAALTDSTMGTADGTLAQVGNTMGGDVSSTINNNFADIAVLVNALRTALVNVGIIKGAA